MIKQGIKNDENNKIPVMKVSGMYFDMLIIKNNKNLIDKEMIKNNSKNYANMLKTLYYNCVNEDLADTIVFSPNNLINSYILVDILAHKIKYRGMIFRSLDISDISFGKSSVYSSISDIKFEHIYIILDRQISEYLQTVIIQIIENRRLVGKTTTVICDQDSSLFGDYQVLDSYMFPDGINNVNWLSFVDIFSVEGSHKSKRGVWKV